MDKWKIIDDSYTSSPNALSRELEDYGQDLILFRDSFIQGSGGFGGQQLKLFERSFPVSWQEIFGGR